MIEISDLPAVNATLNLVSLVFLLVGYHAIRHDNVVRHRRCMVTAFCVSVLFLGSYLTYRFLGQEKRFGGAGLIRPVYFFILVTHVTLAATVPFLAGLTLWRAIRGQFVRHRRIALCTFPIWIYVSITGVMVYVMLFVIWRPAGPVEH